MNTWKVETTGRLLTEVKNKFAGKFTTKDIRWSIDHNRCYVNSKVERFGSVIVKKGDHISIQVAARPSFAVEPDRILFEDDLILAYNKPPSITSEQLATLTGYLLIHRLDRDTTGVLVLAKTPTVQAILEKQFKERATLKHYLAVVEGNPGTEGTIIGFMAPKAKREGAVTWGMADHGVYSETSWISLERRGPLTLIRCTPLTGRTHQIRVHLAHKGFPIAGDPVYGSKKLIRGVTRPLLHAEQLTFSHPASHAPITLSAPCPF